MKLVSRVQKFSGVARSLAAGNIYGSLKKAATPFSPFTIHTMPTAGYHLTDSYRQRQRLRISKGKANANSASHSPFTILI